MALSIILYGCTTWTQEKKLKWKLNKNAACYFEQILEATTHKTAAVRPLTSQLKNHPRRTRHKGHCWRSKDELISDILVWTPRHGRATVDCPARIYSHQVYANIGVVLKTYREWWMIWTDNTYRYIDIYTKKCMKQWSVMFIRRHCKWISSRRP